VKAILSTNIGDNKLAAQFFFNFEDSDALPEGKAGWTSVQGECSDRQEVLRPAL
jgi:hypothetical protein